MDILGGLIYGFIVGFSEFVPVSVFGHRYLISYLSEFNANMPLMNALVYFGALTAVIVYNRQKLSHIRRELKVAALPKRRRKRMPDMQAVLDFRLITTGLIPMIACILLSGLADRYCSNLPLVGLMLLLSGVAVFVPEFLRQGNRDSRGLTGYDGLLLGMCTGLAVIPGVSKTGTVIAAGQFRGCSRQYMLDIAFLISIPFLAGLMIYELICFAFSGMPAPGGLEILNCLLAGAAAFGSATSAIYLMDFLAVKAGFYGFAYYNWGLSLFCFALYLIT